MELLISASYFVYLSMRFKRLCVMTFFMSSYMKRGPQTELASVP